MSQITLDLPEIGGDEGEWGDILNLLLAALISQGNLSDSTNTHIRSVKYYGAVGDGVTDDSSAIAAALAANAGKSIYFPPGQYLVNSSTRLLLEGNFTTLIGDPSGLGSQIIFTHVNGGLDVGNGVDNIYENRLSNITFLGSGTVNTIVRCRKMYEPHFKSVRIENGSTNSDACGLELNDCGQLDSDRLVIQGCKSAIRVTGSSPALIGTLRLTNFYQCDNGIMVATGPSGGIPKILVESSWFEAVANIVNIDVGTNALSIGQIVFRDTRFLKVSGDFRLFKTTAHGVLNINQLKFAACSVTAYLSTTALVDFSAVENNAGSIYVEINDRLDVEIPASTQPLIKMHPTQSWWLAKTKIDKVIVPGGTLLDPGRWSGDAFETGGTFPEPYSLVHVGGSPEGVLNAPSGSICRLIEGGDQSIYIKTFGNDAVGWKALSVVAT